MGISDYFKIPDDTPENFVGYCSPIEMIMSDIQTQIENDTVKACQSYGFRVDKEELAKALKYDRDQYDKGYKDGYSIGFEEGKREVMRILSQTIEYGDET